MKKYQVIKDGVVVSKHKTEKLAHRKIDKLMQIELKERRRADLSWIDGCFSQEIRLSVYSVRRSY
jgi:hypothetical protein